MSWIDTVRGRREHAASEKKKPFRFEHKGEAEVILFFFLNKISFFLLILGKESNRDKFNVYGIKKSPHMSF